MFNFNINLPKLNISKVPNKNLSNKVNAKNNFEEPDYSRVDTYNHNDGNPDYNNVSVGLDVNLIDRIEQTRDEILSNKYTTKEQRDKRAVEAYKINIEIVSNNNDLIHNNWNEHFDSKWHYESIKDLNVDETKKEEIKNEIDKANMLQNSLNLIINALNKGVQMNKETKKYEITIGDFVVKFNNLNDAQLYLKALEEKKTDYEDEYEQHKTAIIYKIRQLYIDHYNSIRDIEKDEYNIFLSNYKAEDVIEGKNFDEVDPLALYEAFRAGHIDEMDENDAQTITFEWSLVYDYMEQSEIDLFHYLYANPNYGPEEAKKYFFYIEEGINRKIASEHVANFIEHLKYSDLIWLKNDFPNIENSDKFNEYKSSHTVKDVPGKGVKKVKVTSKMMPDGTYRDITDYYYEAYTDEEKQMYWYLYDSKEYGSDVAEYYLKYLDGEGDLEDSFKNRFFVGYKSFEEGIISWLENAVNVVSTNENHSVSDYEKLWILMYLAEVSPKLEAEYKIFEKIGEAAVPGVIALACAESGAGGYVFNILVGIGTMGETLHMSGMEGYTGLKAFFYGLAKGGSKTFILTVLQNTLGSKVGNSKILSAVVDVISDMASLTISDGVVSAFEQLMTGSNVSLKDFSKEEAPKVLEIGLISAIFNSTAITIEFSKDKVVHISESQAATIIEMVKKYDDMDLKGLLAIIAKVTGMPADEISEEVPVAILKGIIKGS